MSSCGCVGAAPPPPAGVPVADSSCPCGLPEALRAAELYAAEAIDGLSRLWPYSEIYGPVLSAAKLSSTDESTHAHARGGESLSALVGKPLLRGVRSALHSGGFNRLLGQLGSEQDAPDVPAPGSIPEKGPPPEEEPGPFGAPPSLDDLWIGEACHRGILQIDSPFNQRELSEACGLNLGPCPVPEVSAFFPGGVLRRTLTGRELRAVLSGPLSVSREETLDTLLPDFWSTVRRFSFGDESAGRLVAIPDYLTPMPGLFFEHVLEGPAKLALRMLYAHADFVDLAGADANPGYSAYFARKCKSRAFENDARRLSEIFRVNMEDGDWTVKLFGDEGQVCFGTRQGQIDVWPELQIDSDRRLVASRTWGPYSPVLYTTAMTPVRRAYLCPGYSAECQIADYYFWWAQRLLHLAYSGQSSRPVGEDLLLAVLSARCGLAEIVNLSALLVHEWSHITGSWTECASQACCHYMLEWFFQQLVTAEYGLPVSHLPFVSTIDYGDGTSPHLPQVSGVGAGRFDVSGAWQFELSTACGGDVNNMTPSPLGVSSGTAYCLGTHVSLLGSRHGLSISYGFPTDCSNIQSGRDDVDRSEGSVTFNTSDFGGVESIQECLDNCGTSFGSFANEYDCIRDCISSHSRK